MLPGYNEAEESIPGLQSLAPTAVASPTFWKSTARARRDLLPLPKILWLAITPLSSTAMPTPAPFRPVIELPLAARTPVTPVDISSRLALRAVMRLGEMPCTSLRAARLATWLAGSNTDNAVTDK